MPGTGWADWGGAGVGEVVGPDLDTDLEAALESG